ncbi:MAG TPA: dehydrogenase [Bacteroidales bacterium]|nr:dehydrogenase [Bacteroidales bacterium]
MSFRNKIKRRNFIKTSAAGAAGFGLLSKSSVFAQSQDTAKRRVGIIGLDTSHSTAFTGALNNPSAGPEFGGYKVTAAYPWGSNDIKSSVDRIAGYTEEVKKLGVEIVESIGDLLKKTDVILLETNDGRLHLDQALQVMKAGKRLFIDKPIAASLTDAVAIFNASQKFNVPVFSSSSLRYISGADDIAKGSIGKVLGADTYSPATIEKTHPDLFWYGVHGVETLFTLMGTGCKSVTGTFTEDWDQVTGLWSDNRIGTFRGLRKGKTDYGGIVFGEKGIVTLGRYNGYDSLLAEIIRFFQTGVAPVSQAETIEIFAFMTAASESKKLNGTPVLIESVIREAEREAGEKADI